MRLPAEWALALGLVGLALGLLAMGTGFLALGVLGLLLLGLAVGCSGNQRQRLWVALLLWLLTSVLALCAWAFGAEALQVAGPLIFSLLFIAVGQCLGLLSALLLPPS